MAIEKDMALTPEKKQLLFEKKGVITPQETNSTLFAIDKSKNQRLQTDYKRNMKRVLLFGGLLLALGVGYTLFMRSKNRQ